MNTLDEPFFSWTSRRVVVDGAVCRPAQPGQSSDQGTIEIVLDVAMTVGGHTARLLAFAESGDDYVALLVGAVAGGHDVPIRVVEEELLLITASRSTLPAEILVGIPALSAVVASANAPEKVLASQVCCGGPIRDMLDVAGVHSVIVELLAPAALAA